MLPVPGRRISPTPRDWSPNSSQTDHQPDVGARLFLSPHTIDFHLRQMYRRLGVRSRVELAGLRVPHVHRRCQAGGAADRSSTARRGFAGPWLG